MSENMYVVLNELTSEFAWHVREQGKYPLHPTLAKILEDHRPGKLKALLLEWPHVSETDSTRVAYTRSVEHGEQDRQTVTSLGKYLRRHFTPDELPDHAIRDATALAQHEEQCKITYDLEEMIRIVQEGPTSCMQGGFESDAHPYEVYLPKYGWHMAYRTQGDGEIWGRCLCLVHEGQKMFVRSYKKCSENGYSHSDEGLEAWLLSQGYEHECEWPNGAKLDMIEEGIHLVAPYLDGDIQNVDEGLGYLYINEEGEYPCTSTSGYTEKGDDTECAECGDGINTNRDDYSVAGIHEDTPVCSHCIDYHFHYVQGRNGNQYWLHSRDTVTTVEGSNYDDSYLGDNDIVELHDGEYTHIDNAIRASDEEWYHVDDIGHAIVKLQVEHNDSDYAPTEDTWECEASGNVYHDDVESCEDSQGRTVHPDYLDEDEDETETEIATLAMTGVKTMAEAIAAIPQFTLTFNHDVITHDTRPEAIFEVTA